MCAVDRQAIKNASSLTFAPLNHRSSKRSDGISMMAGSTGHAGRDEMAVKRNVLKPNKTQYEKQLKKIEFLYVFNCYSHIHFCVNIKIITWRSHAKSQNVKVQRRKMSNIRRFFRNAMFYTKVRIEVGGWNMLAFPQHFPSILVVIREAACVFK